jgi:flagellar protein FlaG
MSNDFGTIKAVLPPVAQTSPPAHVKRSGDDNTAPVAPAVAEKAEKTEEAREPLNEVVSELNNLVRDLHRELQFSVDDKSGETVIKVVDSKTDEVVRQIPSEEVVRLRQRLEDVAGVIFRDSA